MFLHEFKKQKMMEINENFMYLKMAVKINRISLVEIMLSFSKIFNEYIFLHVKALFFINVIQGNEPI